MRHLLTVLPPRSFAAATRPHSPGATLEGQIDEAARVTGSAKRLRTEMDELRRQGEGQLVSFELTMAGAHNIEAATVLFPDCGKDTRSSRRPKPWLFSAFIALVPHR